MASWNGDEIRGDDLEADLLRLVAPRPPREAGDELEKVCAWCRIVPETASATICDACLAGLGLHVDGREDACCCEVCRTERGYRRLERAIIAAEVPPSLLLIIASRL